MTRVLITGASGFVGGHLARHLREHHREMEIFGASRRGSGPGIVPCDLSDPATVRAAVKDLRPDAVYHLAAQSNVPAAWASPAETYGANVLGQLHLLEAIREYCPRASVLVCGSSEEYGLVRPEDIPIRESTPLRPMNPYAVSKVAQDMMGWQYHASHGMRILRTRAFNHTGPGRPDTFAESSFARQIAEIEAGGAEPVVRVGNLEARRDFTDVRDVVRAYVLLMERGRSGEVYNVASGRSLSMREVLDMLLAMARCEIRVETDPGRMRPSDLAVVEGDYGRLREDTGWQPSIPLERTFADLLEFWRQSVRRADAIHSAPHT